MKKIITFFITIFVMGILLIGGQHTPARKGDTRRILEKVNPSIVQVVAENHKRYVVTGIALDKDLVLTTTLITRYPYHRMFVRTTRKHEFDAKMIGKDNSSALILLKIDKKVLKPIQRATGVEAGDWIAVVGSFYRQFPSIFQGIVSSISDEEMILNAPIVPGVTGGAVVNDRGELAAVVRGRFSIAFGRDISIRDHRAELVLKGERSPSRNLCYAIPVKKINNISRQLRDFGKVKRGWLGVYTQKLEDQPGALITMVVKESPASKSGLKKGDVIISINGETIKNSIQVGQKVKTIVPGNTVRVEVIRGKKRNPVLVRVGDWEKRNPLPLTLPDGGSLDIRSHRSLPRIQNYFYDIRASKKLGISVSEITADLAKKFSVAEGYGLMISKIERGSAADKAGLQVGDIIVKANKQNIRTNANIRYVLQNMKGKEPLHLKVYRNGKIISPSLVPLPVVDTPFSDFSRFSDFLGEFSINLMPFNDALFKLRDEKDKLRMQIEMAKRQATPFTNGQIDTVRSKLIQLKKQVQRLYQNRLKRLESEQKRIIQNRNEMLNELERLLNIDIKGLQKQDKRSRDKERETNIVPL